MKLLNLNPNRHPNLTRSRGTALIATIWVIIILTATALVLARSMRVETLASANRLAQAQAQGVERGAEQFLCSVVDQEVATPGATNLVGMEARQIGDGYFWVLKMDPNNQQNRLFGLTDEASKIDLNSATYSATGGGMLQMLPNMPADVAASIYNWSRTGQTSDGLGATDMDYESLPDPYLCKHAPFETTEEVRLVKGVDDNILFGSDTNRDGFLDTSESAAAGTAVNAINTSPVGLFPFITAYGQKATKSSGSGTTDLNTASQTKIRSVLTTAGIASASRIVNNMFPGNQRNIYRGVFDWAIRSNLTKEDLAKVMAQLTANVPNLNIAKINVNTAPKQVLMCLPGLEESDADAIVAARQTATATSPADISWMMGAIPNSKLTAISQYLTGTSKVFSADILAVSPDGRAFSRFRVVIDGSKAPASLIYRKDITRYGWPLGSDIRDALRAGNPPPDLNAAATSTNTPFGQGN